MRIASQYLRMGAIGILLIPATLLGAKADVFVARSQSSDGERYSWTYSISFRELQTTDKQLHVRLAVPQTASFAVIEKGKERLKDAKKEGVFYQWTFERSEADILKAPPEPFEVRLVLSGLSTEVTHGSTQFQAAVGGTQLSEQKVDGPEVAFDPSFFRLAFGGGANLGYDDFAEFEVKGENIFTKNDSRLRASALFGGLFKLRDLNREKARSLDLLTSLEFSEGTSRVLDGFVLGLSYSHNKYLSFVLGYSLRRQSELSPGFLREAKMINPSLDLNDKAYRGLDGMSLLKPGATARFFPGNPIIESFNNSVHIGVVIPIRFGSIFALPRGGR